MSDFAVAFDATLDLSPAATLLRQRPHLETRPTIRRDFPWGAVIVQSPAGSEHEPLTTASGEFFFCSGRPTWRNAPAAGHHGFMAALADAWSREGPGRLWERLSGLFVVCCCDASGLTLLTDPMGVRPAYVAVNDRGEPAGAGTHVDSLAQLAGRRTSFDSTSLAELLVFSNITYPSTTREGISELPPGSLIRFVATAAGMRMNSTALWEPRERDPGASRDLCEELVEAMRIAARGITAGVSRVGFTLSGGRDSRAILCALPADKRDGAITYVTRPNRESAVAQKVAAAAGVPHFFAQRPADFYEHLMERTVALQGSEQRAQAHGLCIPDAALDEQFDIIVSGQLADTFLKDHFMPPWLRARATAGRRRLMRREARGERPAPDDDIGTVAWLEHRAGLRYLRPEVAARVRERHRARLAAVAEMRPESAAEWVGIWPASRRYSAASHVQGNSRTFASDVLYAHRAIIDVAVRIPLALRIDGALANQAFQRLYGPLAAIEDANTGLPVAAGALAETWSHWRRRLGGRASAFKQLTPSDAPWNDVQSSWADMKVLQRRSAHWAALRLRLLDTPALDALASVLVDDPRNLLRGYDAGISFAMNFMAVQLAYYLDRAANP